MMPAIWRWEVILDKYYSPWVWTMSPPPNWCTAWNTTEWPLIFLHRFRDGCFYFRRSLSTTLSILPPQKNARVFACKKRSNLSRWWVECCGIHNMIMRQYENKNLEKCPGTGLHISAYRDLLVQKIFLHYFAFGAYADRALPIYRHFKCWKVACLAQLSTSNPCQSWPQCSYTQAPDYLLSMHNNFYPTSIWKEGTVC